MWLLLALWICVSTVLVMEIGQKFFGENSVQSGCGWNLKNIMTPERHLFKMRKTALCITSQSTPRLKLRYIHCYY